MLLYEHSKETPVSLHRSSVLRFLSVSSIRHRKSRVHGNWNLKLSGLCDLLGVFWEFLLYYASAISEERGNYALYVRLVGSTETRVTQAKVKSQDDRDPCFTHHESVESVSLINIYNTHLHLDVHIYFILLIKWKINTEPEMFNLQHFYQNLLCLKL